jgi:large subunit ribosomal protein L3
MLLAKKKNMTQVFDENGIVSPATILDFSSCRIIKGQKKSGDFIGIGNKKKPSKPEIGKYGESVPEYAVQTSQESVIELNPGDIVNVTSVSKGKGFAGVVRMWNFKGGRRTHGQSDRERRPGSIGAGTTMGRVLPGLKMARNKGNERVKITKVKVLEVNNDEKLLVLKGSIPGTYNSVVEIVKS